MWAQLKVKVKVNAQPRATYFPKLREVRPQHVHARLGRRGHRRRDDADAGDAQHVGDKGVGFYNYGRSTNDKFDALAAQSSVEADPAKREELVKAALREHKEQVHHIPLHRQVIPWAARSNVDGRAPRRQLARGRLGDDRQVGRGERERWHC